LANLVASKAYISYVDSSIANALSSNAILANVVSVNANVAAANAAILTKANLSGANFTGNITANSISTVNYISSDSYIIAGPAIGESVGQIFDNAAALFYGNSAGHPSAYFQLNLQNFDSAGSGDLVVTADDGGDLSNFIAVGMSGSVYSDPVYPWGQPHSGYVFTTGGNLQLQSATHNVELMSGNLSVPQLQLLTSNVLQFNHGLRIRFSDGTVQSTAFGGNANIASINANISAANVRIASLQTATTLSNLNIISLQANTGNLAASINTLTSNAAAQSISLAAINSVLTLSNANATAQSTEINALRANVIASNANITILQGNITSLKIDINSLYSNAGLQTTTLNTLVANAATQASTLSDLYANAATQNASLASLTANAAVQSVQINLINANVSAANANIVSAQNGLTLANISIATLQSNIGVYSANIIMTNANVAAANIEINKLRANITAANLRFDAIEANLAIGSSTVGSILANVEAANAAIITKANISGQSFTGNIRAPFVTANTTLYSLSNLVVGSNTSTTFANAGATFVGNVNSAYQVVVQNKSTGNAAITSLKMASDASTDNTVHLIAGITSSTYSVGQFQNFENANRGNTAFISAIGANLVISSNSNIWLNSNSSGLVVFADGDVYLRGSNLRFSDDTVQTTAITDVPALYANIGTLNINVATLTTNVSTLTGNIDTLTSNAATQASALNTLDANLGTATTNITSLTSNAATQATAINLINANITAANLSISDINSNLGSYQTFANANTAVQAVAIDSVNANIGAYQTWANTGGYLANITGNYGSVNFGSNITLTAEVGTSGEHMFSIRSAGTRAASFASNANIIVPNNSWIEQIREVGGPSPKFNINNWDANIGTLRTDADTLLSNAGTQATAINSINANVGAYQLFANANVIAIQSNLGSFQTFANANAAVQTGLINTINANVAAANAAIAAIDFSSLTATNANVAAANVEIVSLRANITAANSAIATTNANITAANIEIVSLRANITAGNALSNLRAITSNVVPNVNITYDLGENSKRWANIYANTALYLGLSTITTSGGNIYVDGNPVGAGTYGNTQVAQYLPFHNANIAATNVNASANVSASFITASGNITALNLNAIRVVTSNVSYTMGNGTHWLTSVSNVAAALDQIAARLYALENP
jgi:predicted  nucleic acid-binding Zn-ribbon protein